MMSTRRSAPTGRGRRWGALLVVLVAFLLSGALIGAAGEAERDSGVDDALPRGYDSTTVARLLEKQPDGGQGVALVLFTSDSGDLDDATQAQLGALIGEVTQQYAAPGGQPAGSDPSGETDGAPQGSDGPALQVSDDGSAALGVVPLAPSGGDNRDDAQRIKDLRADLDAGVPAGVQAQVTGPDAIKADLASVFDGANLRLLAATATVVALLLLITYRSPVLWLIPLTVVAVADRVAVVLATHGLLAVDLPWDGSTTGILSVLVFGAGTDYALLLISRYRDELRVHDDRYAAMGVAWRATAHAVLASSTTVVLGLLTLLLSLVPNTRGLGAACALGVVVAAAFVLLVLPCALVLCGRWVFWPLIPRVGQEVLADSRRSWWRRLGDRVALRPVAYAVGVVLLLGVFASGLLQVRAGLPEADQFLETPESIAAATRIGESFPAGTSDPVVVLTRADAAQVEQAAADTAGVDSAAPARGAPSSGAEKRIDVVLASAPGSDEAADSVQRLREALAGFDDTWVGGSEAVALDNAAAAERDRDLIVPVILVLVLLALMLLLRSLVAPVLLVLTVIGTYLAALGVGWWIFRAVFDFPAMDATVPLYAFLFLVALGVDYNIFLVTRAAQEAGAHGLREGMLRALTATGGVITSAGILLAAVFAVLGVLPLVVLAQLGIVICLGVLLDTLVVRTVLVPALALILGERFWWPRRLTD